MGIIARFKSIMEANINALLDKAEDPEKMIDQLMRDLTDDLAKVKEETAGVIADEKQAKRRVDECKAEIEELMGYAKKAVAANNDVDAKKFLNEKAKKENMLVSLEATYATAKANADNMRAMHDKLVNDLHDLDARKDVIKGKMAVAKAQQRVNEMSGSAIDGANSRMAAFERMEAKADDALDRAQAMADLNKSQVDDMKSLKDKYGTTDADIDAELAALKAEVNK